MDEVPTKTPGILRHYWSCANIITYSHLLRRSKSSLMDTEVSALQIASDEATAFNAVLPAFIRAKS